MYFKVKAHPGSKKDKIIKKAEDSFEVYVRAKPERGLANKAVIKTLSTRLRIPLGRIRLVKGARSKNKIFEISL